VQRQGLLVAVAGSHHIVVLVKRFVRDGTYIWQLD